LIVTDFCPGVTVTVVTKVVVLVPPYKAKGGLKLKEEEVILSWYKATYVVRDVDVTCCKKPEGEVVEGKVHKGDDVKDDFVQD